MENNLEKLDFNKVYHIYNRGNNKENLFIKDDDYKYFLKKYDRFISNFADTFSYCLMPNHFHFLVRIKDDENINLNLTGRIRPVRLKEVQQAFSNFFNSYTKSFNKAHSRTGKLFSLPFKRILIDKDNYFTHLIYYIHRNPIHHHYSKTLVEWKYSSYNILLSNSNTLLKREEVMEWFGGEDAFINFHEENLAEYDLIKNYMVD